jgi:putative Mn2+ efflux pump MntP
LNAGQEHCVGIIEIVIVGLALSMDAFAVTMSNACAYPGATKAQRIAMPVVFGLFQGLMPLAGYFAGGLAASFIDQYAGIVALIILACIGGKMVWGGLRALRAVRVATKSAKGGVEDGNGVGDRDGDRDGAGDRDRGGDGDGDRDATDDLCPQPQADSPRQLSFVTLLAQGVATSIDAFIVGVSFLALGAPIAVAAPLVALTTFVCCLVALGLGRRFGVLLGDRAEIVGGVVLILIGVKALF